MCDDCGRQVAHLNFADLRLALPRAREMLQGDPRSIDAFGIERCMWGTDWTCAVELLTYDQGVEPFRVTDSLSHRDRAALMGGSLQKIYNWTLDKA
jgi:predicted TIM-barrel fold metal-dependent hydrolase